LTPAQQLQNIARIREQEATLLAIGQVEHATGVRATTIRAWERHGLLHPDKTAAGRRVYDPEDVARIIAIDRMRRVQGLNLSAIRQVLKASGDEGRRPARSPAGSNVGIGVRARRLAQGLSVRELAARTGLAASFVSMLERGAANPSPASLSRLAEALGTTLTDLLGHAEANPSGLIQAGAGRTVQLGPLVQVEQLSVGKSLMDAEIWSLAPGAESEGPYAHDGEELIHVLAGSFEIGLDTGPMRTVAAGDSLYFASGRPHRWRNPGPEPARLLWANTDANRLAGATSRSMRREHASSFPEIKEDFQQVFRVVDSHTAGHPTRVLLDPVPGLEGDSVGTMRELFVQRFDHLRGMLLHEPRGHAATFGVVLVPSRVADFGAIFVSSYKYLDMCGHGTIGLARTLKAMGRLSDEAGFSLETPAGVVEVRLGPDDPRDVTLRNVPARLLQAGLEIQVAGAALRVDIAYGGMTYAIVPAERLGLRLVPDEVARAMAAATVLKNAANEALAAAGSTARVDSVLLFKDLGPQLTRHLVVLEANKFDRSPCGTGTSARLAQLHAAGRLAVGEALAAESITGVRFMARIADVAADGIVPEITGRAHITGLSMLVVEEDDPLQGGFLCR
jgi:proline racemase/DNA-binding transcriptional MerR regulator/quercetin dioxygenase-like cupin family protein